MQEEDLIAITGEGFLSLSRFQQMSSGASLATRDELRATMNYPGVATLWGYHDSEDREQGLDGDSGADKMAIEAPPTAHSALENILDSTTNKGLTYVKEQLLVCSGLSFADLVQVLGAEYMAGQLILAPSDGSSCFSPKLDDLRLCASTLAFIRLHKCTGWNISLLDAALCCLIRGSVRYGRPSITPATVCELSAIQELNSLLGQDMEGIMVWWGDLYTNGPDSLYAKRFLQHAMTETGIFTADNYGRFLSDENAVAIQKGASVLQAALRISPEELASLMSICGLGPNSPLTLGNVFLLSRVLNFCNAMDIPLREYSSFCSIFAPDSADVFGSPSETLAAVKTWKTLSEAGWSLSQLLLCTKTLDKVVSQDKTHGSYTNTAVASTNGTIASYQHRLANERPRHARDDPESHDLALGKEKAGLEFAAFNKECETVTDKEQLEEAWVAKYNELVQTLRLHLLRQSIFDTVNADFSDMTASMTQLIMSDLAKVSWQGKMVAPMQMIQGIVQEIASSSTAVLSPFKVKKTDDSIEGAERGGDEVKVQAEAANGKDASPTLQIAGFCSPTATGKYWFSLKTSSTKKEPVGAEAGTLSRLFIDNTPILLDDKTPSVAVRFLGGQTYYFEFYSSRSADGLLWSTTPDSTGLEFPVSAIIDIATVQGVENAYSAIARITSTVGLAQLNLEELQFFAGILGSKVVDLDQMSLKEVAKLNVYRRIRNSLSQNSKVLPPLLDFFKWTARPDKTAAAAEGLVDEIVRVTGWTEFLVKDVLAAKYPSIDVQEQARILSSVDEFAALNTAMEAIGQVSPLGWSVEEAFKHAAPLTSKAELFDMALNTRGRLQIKTDKAGKSRGLSTPALVRAYDRLFGFALRVPLDRREHGPDSADVADQASHLHRAAIRAAVFSWA
ncbi:toxin subunit protein [Colletotrichum tofieldiae]|nr:toxin subunit protein [Colletotrichum tofieldiae]